MAKKQKILVIVGPTASGKSALAVRLARRFNAEIISADSRQVYRGLDVGTGKMTKREMHGVRHHLLDIVSPKQTCTAHDYVIAARRSIADITARGKLPIVVGGTGFYIDALVGRITLPDVPADQALRAKLHVKATAQLFALLKKRDSRRAKSIDPHNKVRLVRALEVARALGKSPTPQPRNNYDLLWIGIEVVPTALAANIHTRLLKRIPGMIAEAKRLHTSGLSYKRMNEFGLEYRYLARLLQKKLMRKAFEFELEHQIRHYAKRQLTYWRRNKEIHWHAAADSKMQVQIKRWLKK